MESVAHHASTLLDFPSSRELLARFTYYDYAVFVCMLAMSGSLGLWSAWHDNRSDAKSGISLLLNGERRLPAVPVGASLMASFISAAYLLGNAAEVYRNGTLYMMTFVSYALSLAVTAHLFMPVFYRLEVMTAYEYLELRFNRAVRMAAVILYVFEMTIYIAISLYAPALALSQLTGMTLWSAVVAIGLVCTVYTSVGGIKAVVLTDTFQAVVTVVAMVVVIALGMYQLGGLREVWRTSLSGGRVQFDVIDPNPTVHYTVWGLAFGSFFTNTASYATNHMMVLRYLTVPTLSKAKFVVWFNFPLLCTVLSLSSLAGLLVYVKYASCDPVAAHQISTEDQLLPYFVMDVLGKMTGVPGLFVAGIFAASLSSISSGVNALCAVSYVDIIAIIKPDIPDKIGAKIIVALGVFFGLLTIGLVGIASRMGNVLAASQVITSSIGGPLLGLFTLGMFIPCGNSKGAMTGLIVSLGFSLWINLGQFVISMALPKPSPSTDGCPAEVKNASSAVLFDGTTVLKETTNSGLLPDIYALSSLWYSMLAWFVLLVVAVPVSYFTSSSPSTDTMNPKLICQVGDVVFWFAPEKFRRHLRFNVGKNYVEPEKPPATPEKRASMPQVVFDCEKKAEKKKHDSSLTAVSYIRRGTSASLAVPPPPPAPRISLSSRDFNTHM
ncbi:sodium-coupled monocarboxylate transporter 1 [Rhipicephalus sanguineus]|uniref:sodium-coupled monocarboxylate transporter 1 n=1 Tax=Rhipicephalus sanguineus TaxID=34632 RepID=UPI001894B80E|nr:sodium-coupled monocarboxylate transporter 1 [Rhipicephalus sanguineus]